jgi:oxygen-dependent protoporphyrinogen oxidase
MTEGHRPHVVVVGGGIAGLTTAFRLARSSNGLPIDVTVLEAASTPGGKLRTIDVDGLPVEAGADSFVVRKPWAVELCKELGLGEELLVPGATGAHVWTRGRLVPFPSKAAFGVPGHVGELLGWDGLPRSARLRALGDLLRPARKAGGDESLGALVERRLGKPALEVLVGPILAGLHAGDPYRLSVRATFPELETWERNHGSLIRGARAALRGSESGEKGRSLFGRGARSAPTSATAPMFATVWGGLSRLVETLQAGIGGARVRVDAPVSAIRSAGPLGGSSPSGGGFFVEVGEERFVADAVALAAPAFESARLTEPLNREAARELAGISYASTAVVILVYPEGTAERLPWGSGFVTPTGERTITACTWVSRKWPDDRFGDRAVVRCFVGRAGEEEALALTDDRLVATVRGEFETALAVSVDPEAVRVVRWPRAMPQYEVGHLERLRMIEAALGETPGLFVVGSAYGGVGIADTVRQANEVAGRIRAYLQNPETARRGAAGSAGDVEREAIGWTS